MENRFFDKNQWIQTFFSIVDPLQPFFKATPGYLFLGNSGSVYGESIQGIEGFLRPLWGIAPYLTCEKDDTLIDIYKEGIVEGTDPYSEKYWGKITDNDQRMVEMASLSHALIITKKYFWDELTKKEQENLYQWLDQINHKKMPKNNWVLFRVLVNVALEKCTGIYNETQIKRDLELVESFYIGDGWYCDGEESQIDYYVSFAIHYYLLLYYSHMKTKEIVFCEQIKERAIKFAQKFQYWFDEKGEALPFGRSLTYRFAQCSFWTALVYADIEALPWGEIKGLINRNMRQWFSKEIFSTDQLLTIGYHYENLVMAEGYNAPGSPYWAMKSFLLLAVPETHDFWKAEEKEKVDTYALQRLPEARMLVNQTKNQNQAYVAGQLEEKQAHVDAKYSKLVYSTQFGFSISKGSIYYKQGGFDNCLALSENDLYYRSKLKTRSFEICSDRVINEWDPWKDVEIKTTVIPFGEWHLRIHEIDTQRDLFIKEGGYSLPIYEENTLKRGTGFAKCSNPSVGTSLIKSIQGYEEAEIIVTEPNTNLYFKRSYYPYLSGNLLKGRHRLISLVGGLVEEDSEKSPDIFVWKNDLEVHHQGKVLRYKLDGSKP